MLHCTMINTNMWMLYLTAALLSVIQIHSVAGCNITSVTSSTASSLDVVWDTFPSAIFYRLELDDLNTTNSAPVIVNPIGGTQQTVEGLRPGHTYDIKLQAFTFLGVELSNCQITGKTVPGIVQITSATALSSTSIRLEWDSVDGADTYTAHVGQLFTTDVTTHVFTTLFGEITGLTPSTTYRCYITASNSAGTSVDGSAKSVTTLVPPPPDVAITVTGNSTAKVTWTARSGVLQYQVVVTDTDTSNPPVTSTTSNTYLDISNLEPCSTYTVGVSSLNSFSLPGEPNNVSHTTSTINPVTTFSQQYNCSTATSTVTWVPVYGGNSYMAKATDGSGESLNCASNSTSCDISMLKCGESYTVRVSVISDDCSSESIVSKTFDTVPCAPANPTITVFPNAIKFEWEVTNNTIYYVGKSIDMSNQVTECRTPLNECAYTDVTCGQTYTFSVQAISSECNSAFTEPKEVKTVPCTPTNIQTSSSCMPNKLMTTWDAADGAENYTVTVHGNVDNYICNTTNTSCEVDGIPCGEHVSVYLKASNEVGSSPEKLIPAGATVPCTPTNVTASNDCSPDNATVSWFSSKGVVFYIVVAVDSSGTEYSCNTLETSCELENLACGETYTAKVIGNNIECNSSDSASASFATGPCIPVNVTSQLDCQAGTAEVSWAPSANAVNYTMKAINANGPPVYCYGPSTSCSLTALDCNQQHMITVTASDAICTSAESQTFNQDPVPCAPQNVQTSPPCSSNELVVSWDPVSGDWDYNVTAVSSSGTTVKCSTSSNNCTLIGLQCGQNYTITVVAFFGSCIGPASSPVIQSTAPCAPDGLTTDITCGSNDIIIIITNGPHSGPVIIIIIISVSGPNGFSTTCTTTNNTCQITGLQCGTQYNVSAVSGDVHCNSPPTEIVVTTGPCDPANVNSDLICSSDSAIVSWDAALGAETYRVTATDSSQSVMSCTNSTTSCLLQPLNCGETYSLTVVSESTVCNSTGTIASLTTAPCPPTIQSNMLMCGTNMSTLSWSSVQNAVGYTVNAVPTSGPPVSCTSSALSNCSLNGLQCSETYTATVVAQGSECDSAPSSNFTIETAPCSPTITSTQFMCSSSSATITWTEPPGSTGFYAEVVGDYTDSCDTLSNNCTFLNIPCGLSLHIHVTAKGSECNSEYSVGDSFDTVPCAPENLGATLICDDNSAMVTWGESSFAVNYTVMATGSNSVSQCHNVSTTCMVQNLQCGEDYNIAVTPHSAECTGLTSDVYTFQSGLCAPTSASISPGCQNTVNWSNVAGAENVIATATDDSGPAYSCESNSLDSCNFTDMPCGGNYSVSVVTVDRGCSSQPVSAGQLLTAQCPPTNLEYSINCSVNAVTLTWDQSSVPGTTYSIETEVIGGTPPSVSNASGTTSTISLQCGQTYNFSVAADDGNCLSSYSPPIQLSSKPCVPQNPEPTYTVGVARVQWTAAQGAATYSIEAVADQSTSVFNTSTSSQTELTGLDCDKTYNITVTANNEVCDPGATSQQIQQKTEPCPPTNVQANIQCDQHSAIVSWNLSENAEGYIAFLQNQQGHNIFCEATGSATSCEATGLQCGTMYNVSAIAVGNPYNSSLSSETFVTAEPCAPSNINVSVDCEARVATISWQASEGAQSYVTELRSSDHTDICSSSSCRCQPSHLHCGEEYNVSVTAVGVSCNTTGYMAANFYTEPCNVTGVNATYTVGSALIQWDATQGATSYSAAAVTDQGAPSECNSTSETQCTVSGLQCSELYNVTVSAHNQACNSEGVTSDTLHVITEPCPPTNIQSAIACGQSKATISWDKSDFALGYIAYINDTYGDMSYCEGDSSDTSCDISGLDCGSVYNAWVVAKGKTYNSSDSRVISFTSGPCLPQAIDVEVDCNSDGGATVNWTAVAGANFSVSSGVGGNLQTLCATLQNNCVVSGLSCGQTYNLSLEVTKDECTLPAPAQGRLSTRPCMPTGISPSRSCSSGDVTITWQPSDGADSYTVDVTSGPNSESCVPSASSLTCTIPALTCGQNYSVSVTASNAECSVTSSEPVHQATAPCVPTNVNAVMNCTTDTATVSWDASDGATEYTVIGQSEQNSVYCDASDPTSCDLAVQCGTQYSLQVVANDTECSSALSVATNLTTAPCPPADVMASISCTTNDLTVTWSPSAHTDHYLVTAVAQNGGYDGSCNVTSSPCIVNSVSCGNEFIAHVTAVRGSCYSQPSMTASAVSAPCQPQNVSGDIDCVRNSARVSWSSALGADQYTVLALGERDLRANCTTSTNTTCEIELECTTRYNFTVTAADSHCDSPASAQIYLETAPCSLTGVRAHTQCHNSTILVEWDVEDGGAGDTEYTATAEDSNNDIISCNSTGNSCYLQNAQCGLRYTIVVSATSDICNDLRSPPHHITTEPCKPDTPSVIDSCGDAVVSWTPSPIAEMYHVFAVGNDGHKHTCNTTYNNCTLTDLHCDEQYSVYAIASHENCSSLPSPNTTLNTGPCKPDNLSVTYYCENSTALLTWIARSNAVSYFASAEDDNGSMLYCSSNTPSCSFDGLQCGSTYNFTVLATHGNCNSSYSDPIDPVGAVPCPPENVTVQPLPLLPQSTLRMLSVSWSASVCSNTEYLLTLTGHLLGASTQQFYVTSYWTTRTVFELPLPCGADYNATVEARNDAGTSDPSTAIDGSIAPCP